MNGFSVVFQHDSMQCGIACLQMVCKYRSSMLSINEAANTLGLHTICANPTLWQQLRLIHKGIAESLYYKSI